MNLNFFCTKPFLALSFVLLDSVARGHVCSAGMSVY